MISGIYKILNKANGKFYIGSAIDFTLRWAQHKYLLRLNNHDSSLLQNTWNKYGEDAFEFTIIEHCEKEKTLEREQFWLDWTKCYNREIGYNFRKNAHSNLGVKWTEEHKAKISASKRGIEQSREAVDVRNAMNRKLDKWPCLLGSICKCRNCKNTRNLDSLNRRWKDFKVKK
jgi:group I intron endonuclease